MRCLISSPRAARGKIVCLLLLAAVAGALVYFYNSTPDPVNGIQPQQYQQFNPFYVVALTPVSLAIFGWLAKRKKEPSAPARSATAWCLPPWPTV